MPRNFEEPVALQLFVDSDGPMICGTAGLPGHLREAAGWELARRIKRSSIVNVIVHKRVPTDA